MSSEVGSGQVAIVPTFKGFRKAVTTETDGAAKDGATGFKKAFSKSGTDAGKTTGKGFKTAFDSSSAGTSDKVTAQLQANVAKASRALSAARLKQQDSVGKVTIAEAKLAEVQKKYATDSSQVITALERLKSATRGLQAQNETTESATKDLRSAQQDLAGAANRTGDQLEKAGSTWGTRFRSGFRSVFAGSFLGTLASNITSSLAGALRDGVRSAIDLVQESIGAASDLQQSLGAVDAVFGKYAASVHTQAKNAAKDVGLSANEYNTLATVLGAQLKNLGTPIAQVSTKTSDLIKLGADLSAQFGGKTSDAVEAVSSLLRGERDPIEKYGVSLKQASIDAEASALGFKKVGGSFDNNAQSLATLSLLYKQTSAAQGTFARENDTLAHKQQVQAALWDNVQAKIGTAFLPVATKLSDVLATKVIPVISSLVDKYGPQLADAFTKSLPAIEKFFDDALPKLPAFLQSVADATPAIIGILSVLTQFAGGAGMFYLGALTATQAMFDLISGAKPPLDFINTLSGAVGPFGELARVSLAAGVGFGFLSQAAATGVAQMAANVATGINTVVGLITGLPGRIVTGIGFLGQVLYNSGRALIRGFIDGVVSMFGPVATGVSAVINFAKGFFPHSPAKRGPLSGAGWREIKESGSSLFEQWTSGFQTTASIMPSLGQLTATGVPSATSTTTTGGTTGAPMQQVRETIHVVLDGRVLGTAVRQYQRSNS